MIITNTKYMLMQVFADILNLFSLFASWLILICYSGFVDVRKSWIAWVQLCMFNQLLKKVVTANIFWFVWKELSHPMLRMTVHFSVSFWRSGSIWKSDRQWRQQLRLSNFDESFFFFLLLELMKTSVLPVLIFDLWKNILSQMSFTRIYFIFCKCK